MRPPQRKCFQTRRPPQSAPDPDSQPPGKCIHVPMHGDDRWKSTQGRRQRTLPLCPLPVHQIGADLPKLSLDRHDAPQKERATPAPGTYPHRVKLNIPPQPLVWRKRLPRTGHNVKLVPGQISQPFDQRTDCRTERQRAITIKLFVFAAVCCDNRNFQSIGEP